MNNVYRLSEDKTQVLKDGKPVQLNYTVLDYISKGLLTEPAIKKPSHYADDRR